MNDELMQVNIEKLTKELMDTCVGSSGRVAIGACLNIIFTILQQNKDTSEIDASSATLRFMADKLQAYKL